MTEKEFLELPDREKDALVAEKVMGWEINNVSAWTPCGSRYARFKDEDTLKLNELDWCSPYSTDISAAWEVVERIKTDFTVKNPDLEENSDRGFGFILENCTENSEEKWLCTLPEIVCAPPFEEMNQDIRALSTTAPLAICIAALKAVGVINE